MKKLNTLLVCSLSMIVMAACSKDNDDDPNPVDPSSSLNAIEKKLIGNWAVDGIYRAKPKSTTDTTSTYTDIMEACEKDNVYTFKASRKYSLNEGSNICTYNQNASDPSWEADWKLALTLISPSPMRRMVNLIPGLLNLRIVNLLQACLFKYISAQFIRGSCIQKKINQQIIFQGDG